MKTTKLSSFTLKLETTKKLDEYAKKNSINKSALVDRLINREVDRMSMSLFDKLNEKPPVNHAMILAPANPCVINEKYKDKDKDEK